MNLSTVRFGVGAHREASAPTGDRDMCIMEAVAFMGGEPWSDAPECASFVISAFLRSWNDALSDHDRDRLLPAAVWVPRLVGSRGDDATEKRRASLALDWLVRVYTPAWLDLVPSLAPHAAALRALPDVVDLSTAEAAGSVVRAAQAAAQAAARAAAQAAARDAARYAWIAAGDAARAAARAAARDAAGDAARYAWIAAGDAAQAAAHAAAEAAAQAAAQAAAGDAARDAARDALRPTVKTLQQSALDLLDRMLACGEHRRKEGA